MKRLPSVNTPMVKIKGVKKTPFSRMAGPRAAPPISSKGRTRKPKRVKL